MLAIDLRNVLEELYNAGAYRVPADEIYWPPELHPAVFRALNIQYITRRAQATQKDADLIIMASHGRGGVGSLMLGSVAAKVLAYSTIPVLIYRAKK